MAFADVVVLMQATGHLRFGQVHLLHHRIYLPDAKDDAQVRKLAPTLSRKPPAPALSAPALMFCTP